MTRRSACHRLATVRGRHLRNGFLIAAVLSGTLAGSARAGVQDWELSEVYRGTDPQLRYVELANQVGGCLFPSSTIDLFDGQGQLIDTMTLTISTACHGAPTYIVLASAEAASSFGFPRDGVLSSELPSSGQLCFRSSATYYDCVRWGAISNPIVDLFGPGDSSAATSPAPGRALARTQSTHVVVDDWTEADPTPRQPNDNSTWEPPDAAPIPDAAPTFDAAPPADAGRRTDAAPAQAAADAGNSRYLDLDTVGGGSCACQSTGAGGLSAAFLLILALAIRRRR